jgi:hypothetical protein
MIIVSLEGTAGEQTAGSLSDVLELAHDERLEFLQEIAMTKKPAKDNPPLDIAPPRPDAVRGVQRVDSGQLPSEQASEGHVTGADDNSPKSARQKTRTTLVTRKTDTKKPTPRKRR